MKSETKIRPKIIGASGSASSGSCLQQQGLESAGAELCSSGMLFLTAPWQPGLLCSAASPSILLSVYLLLMNGAQLISLMARMPVGKHLKGFKSLSLLQESFSLQWEKGPWFCLWKRAGGCVFRGQSSSLQTWTWGSHQIPS